MDDIEAVDSATSERLESAGKKSERPYSLMVNFIILLCLQLAVLKSVSIIISPLTFYFAVFTATREDFYHSRSKSKSKHKASVYFNITNSLL